MERRKVIGGRKEVKKEGRFSFRRKEKDDEGDCKMKEGRKEHTLKTDWLSQSILSNRSAVRKENEDQQRGKRKKSVRRRRR